MSQSPVASRQSPERTERLWRLETGDWRLSSLGPFGPAPHLAVAVSGGADSMALALLADAWAKEQGGRITVLTVDHGLRPESRQEAEQVAAWMKQREIQHHILTPPITDSSNNLQEEARTRRYNALADWCRTHEVLHCLLAHHAGDQRETIAHHLARGDTADGASGMSAMRNYRGVRFLRPLLSTEKDTLIAFLRAHAVDWIEDPSNRNTRFARVRTRQSLQQNPAEAAALSHTAAREGAARAQRDDALAQAAARMVVLRPDGRAELALPLWRALDASLASQLIADLLTTIGGADHRPRRADTQRLVDALQNPTRTSLKRTLHHCLITLRGDALHIQREPAHATEPFSPAKPLAAAPFWWLKD